MKKKKKAAARAVMKRGTHLVLFFAIFFISGFSSLVYEVAWGRTLTLVMGGSVYAVSVILATFMAGLALGSYVFGLRSDRVKSPLRLFALLQLGLGLYGLAFPWLSRLLDDVYLPLAGGMESRAAVLAVRALVSALFLLFPTFLMGGLFPLAVKHLTGSLAHVGRTVGGISAAGSFGGVAGAFLSGIIFIELYGVRTTITIAAAMSVAAALGAFLLANRAQAPEAAPTDARQESPAAPVDLPVGAILFAATLTGMSALAYEVLWTRILIFLLGNITWAFSLMLVAFLAGIAGGNALIARAVDRTKNLVLLIAVVGAAAALLSLLLIPAYDKLYLLKTWILESTGTVNGMLAALFLLCFLAMILPTILIGMAFPALSKAYARSFRTVGLEIGSLYSLNTVGAIAGSLLVAFVMIPTVGMRSSLVLTAAVNALAGAVILVSARDARPSLKTAFVLLPVLLLIGGYAFLPPDIEARGPIAGYERIFREETTGGTMEIYQLPQENTKTLLLNGVPEVATDRISMQTLRLLALLPVIRHPDPKNALVVTFGSGIVAGTMGGCDLERIDCVDIFPGIVEAVPYFNSENHSVLENPLVNLVMEDGRTFLLTSEEDYDIITTDATPTGADSWVLCTKEYYTLCKERLAPDGIFAQWIPLHHLSFEAYSTMLRTIRDEFTHMEVWFTGINAAYGHTIVLASQREFLIDYELFAQRIETPFIREDLRACDLMGPLEVLALRIMDETGVDRMVEGAPLNTDDRPLVSFPTTLPQEKDNLENLSRIMQFRTTPRFSTFPREEGTQVRDMLAGLPERFAGEVLYYSGDPVKALGAFHRALNANPRDRRSYELLSKIELDRAKDRVLRAETRIAKELQSEGLFAKGYVAYAKENYTEAESLFVESIAQSPAFPEPYCYLGLTLMKLGEKEKAEENLKKALEMQSQMGLAKRGLLELSGQL